MNNNLSRNIIVKDFKLIFKTLLFSDELSSNDSIFISASLNNYLHLRVLVFGWFWFLCMLGISKKEGLY